VRSQVGAHLAAAIMLPRFAAGHPKWSHYNGNPVYLVLHIRPDRAVSQTKKAAT
jgi:hypothetical protein